MFVKGNYTLSSFFTSANGPFTIILKKVVAKCNATVGVERDGKVRTEDIAIDLGFADMTMDFQNLGMVASSPPKECIHFNVALSFQDSWAAFSNHSLTTHRIWCSIQ